MPERLAGMDEAAFEQHPFLIGRIIRTGLLFRRRVPEMWYITAGRLWLLHLQPRPGDIVIGTDSKSIREIVREMKKHIDD